MTLARFAQLTFASRTPFLRMTPMSSFLMQSRAYSHISAYTDNETLINWVDNMRTMLKPDQIHVVDGSPEEKENLAAKLIAAGTMEALNPAKRPGSYLARTDPADVARAEQSTFICSETEDGAGITNNWVDPVEMKTELKQTFDGAMRGRTMYVIPYSMGPVGSPLSKIGIQLTDSPFVVLNMGIMTRMGSQVLESLGDGEFVPCLHSVGAPLKPGQKDVPWPCNIPKRKIVHFPETREIWSFGSGYGGNSLLGKKCFALRIASVIARDEGWLAEHMLILGITSPAGKKTYVAAAFPSACGKTNLAMMQPTLPGWKIECVGDDIAWMRFGKDGRLYAINPENGFFGVAPGTSNHTNPNAMGCIEQNTVFTNVAKTADGDVWWEGMTKNPPSGTLTDWLGNEWTASKGTPAAHPNSRFTCPAIQCPVISPEFENPEGVPIDAIIFGGRRPKTIPLVYEAFDWDHGVFVGSSVASEKTAAAEGGLGELRFDPFAMLPFCGYNMAAYFAHWLNMPNLTSDKSKLPKMFHVNWFRQSKGKFLWPGFGENSRVLKWIVERIDGNDAIATKTPIGYVPTDDGLDLSNLEIDPKVMQELLKIDVDKWLKETQKVADYHNKFGKFALPEGIRKQRKALQERLTAAKN
eukprot:NODE_152_length_2095_cov_101.825203_g128_i0.p1 GENE.NODE_152_length_2095_cov_101.825203_g128_i0~~NODE_152_length_2095_cov_101.825203_g128_i0.p1  ORF type:complete len:639 (+),score=165.37 NODE_152_length_2095_cov_101.825203_g128_i0:100-2016(+)